MTVIIRKTKPTSPARRFQTHIVNTELHKGRPLKSLIEIRKKHGGRNNLGRITTRHQAGEHKRYYRLVDFKRNKEEVPARVERFEYDPNRTAHLALLVYRDGERRYIICPKGVNVGDEIVTSVNEVPIKPGNCTTLKNIPVGSTIHCIELKPGAGAQMIRSAGGAAQLIAKEGAYGMIRMRSNVIMRVLLVCKAVLGEVGNTEHNLRKLGKAGASRHRGIRPTVRGVAMNPVDHPHGGGEGRTSAGRHPVSPWGWKTKGKKTRHNKRTDRFVTKLGKKQKRG